MDRSPSGTILSVSTDRKCPWMLKHTVYYLALKVGNHFFFPATCQSSMRTEIIII